MYTAAPSQVIRGLKIYCWPMCPGAPSHRWSASLQECDWDFFAFMSSPLERLWEGIPPHVWNGERGAGAQGRGGQVKPEEGVRRFFDKINSDRFLTLRHGIPLLMRMYLHLNNTSLWLKARSNQKLTFQLCTAKVNLPQKWNAKGSKVRYTLWFIGYF